MGRSNILSLFTDKVLTVLTFHIPSVLIELDINMLTAELIVFEHGYIFRAWLCGFVCLPQFAQFSMNIIIYLFYSDTPVICANCPSWMSHHERYQLGVSGRGGAWDVKCVSGKSGTSVAGTALELRTLTKYLYLHSSTSEINFCCFTLRFFII